MESILASIKKLLGVPEEVTHFDSDIIMHINTTIMDLTQIGVGPSEGYHISDEEDTWADFIGDSEELEAVKTYVYLNVKLLFDPPQNSSTIEVINRQIAKIEWRLNFKVDASKTGEEEIQNG